MRERVIDKNLHKVTEFRSTESFLAANSVPAGISTIWENGLPIDLLVSPASSETTIFFFHGAIERHFTLPVLSGLGISGGLEANRVFISDPSLIIDNSLMLSWYAGNKLQTDLQNTLKQVIAKVARSLNSRRLVFFGGSGGGFASLFLAHHFGNSLALVFNPQTNIAKYSERAVRDFASIGFDIPRDAAKPLLQLPSSVTYDLCQLYRRPTGATVAYIQNLNDTEHVELHLKPFYTSLHRDTQFLVFLDRWREGHAPPPKEFLAKLLNITAVPEDWSTSLKQIGFGSRLELMS